MYVVGDGTKTIEAFGAMSPEKLVLKVYVDTGEGIWSTNGLTFDTYKEAKRYGDDLWSRWTEVRQFAVVAVPAGFGGMYLALAQVEAMKVVE